MNGRGAGRVVAGLATQRLAQALRERIFALRRTVKIAATVLATSPLLIRILQSDTDHIAHDTGAFGNSGIRSSRRGPREPLRRQAVMSSPSAQPSSAAAVWRSPGANAQDKCRAFSHTDGTRSERAGATNDVSRPVRPDGSLLQYTYGNSRAVRAM
jgi:hypothetical protein